MKILIFWDVYGRVWRAALKKELPWLKNKYKPDFVIANIDNISSWRWAIEKHVLELEDLWVDLMTWWDHILDNMSKLDEYLVKDESLLIRPANFQENLNYIIPWKWYKIIENNWKRLLVVHLLWEIFMNHRLDNPFTKIQDIINETSSENLDGIIVDFHKEATAEWYWMAFFLDWKASFIFWTHTHIQTNDELILPKWTWILSDVWMNWPLYSVIWAEYKSVEKRFLTWISKWKIEQCLDKNYVVNGVVVEIWDNMKCEQIEKIRIRWIL